MINSNSHIINFSFPEISEKHHCELSLLSYLTWPVTSRPRRMVPFVSINQTSAAVPEQWQTDNRFICTTYQQENVALSFAHTFTMAFKVSIDGINCLTGDLLQPGLNPVKIMGKPRQDYFVTYYDNIMHSKALQSLDDESLQFSAIKSPADDAFTRQIEATSNNSTTSHEILIEAYPLRIEKTVDTYHHFFDDPDVLDSRKTDNLVTPSIKVPNQDPFTVDDWDQDAKLSCKIHLINFQRHLEIFHNLPDHLPPNATEMAEAGQFWSPDLDGDELRHYQEKQALGFPVQQVE